MPSHSTDTMLEDSQLLAEIRLLADLIIAASERPDELDQPTVDEALGLACGWTPGA